MAKVGVHIAVRHVDGAQVNCTILCACTSKTLLVDSGITLLLTFYKAIGACSPRHRCILRMREVSPASCIPVVKLALSKSQGRS